MPSVSARARIQDERRLRRLLHHVAELAGEHQAPLARHARRLDEQDVAAGRRPGEAGGHAGLVACAPRPREKKRRRPEELATRSSRHRRRGSRLPLGDAARATLRQTRPISRSRLRRPASRV